MGPLEEDKKKALLNLKNTVGNADNAEDSEDSNSSSEYNKFNFGNMAGFATRVGSTLLNYGKAYNMFGLEDDLDLKYKDIIKEGNKNVENVKNIAFGNSFDTLEKEYSFEPYLVKNVTADDFGGYSNIGGTALEGFGSGFAATSGSFGGNPLAGVIGGAADSLVNVSAASKRNARLGKKDWTTDYIGGHTPFTVGLLAPVTGFIPGADVALTSWLGKKLGWNNDSEENIVDKTNAEIDKLNDKIKREYKRKYLNQVSNVDRMQDDFLLSQYAAFGGMLDTNGTDWETGATYIDNGSTHQNNPFGGVQYGVASDGLPNLVEEGEVVIKVKNNQEDTGEHSYAKGGPMYSDYVLSNRVIPTVEELAFANITDNPSKYEGQPYAQIYKDLTKGLKETINSPITKNYLDILHTRIARAQEDTKLREQQEEFMAELKKATPEQQDIILQQMGYTNPLEEATMAAKGGEIYIKPSKRGTFTAAAKKRGMGVQEFASKVLANPENYTEAMRKKAQFAHNAKSFKHANGGYLFPWGGWANQDELNNYYTQQYTDFWNNLQGRKGSNVNRAYLTGAQARQWINQLSQGDEQQQALANMLKSQWGDTNTDWSNNATWEFKNKYNPSGTIVESSPYISWAGDNTAMKDALWGIRHIPQLSVDNRYQQGIYTPNTPEGLQPVNRYWTYDWNTGERTPISSETFNDPASGWFYDETLNEEGRDNENDPNFYRDFYLTNRTSNINTDEFDIDDEFSQKGTKAANYDWILPAISGATVLTDLFGLTNRPDYSNADRIGRAILPPRYIGYNPNGRYVKPQLVDTNYLASRLANQSMAGINAAKDLSGSNRATALANIAAQNYLGQQAIGESIAKGQIENNKAIQDAVQINNAVDRANAEGAFNADRANQAAWDNYIGRYAAQKTAEAKLREDIDNQVAVNRSANWNNFLENMQGYFDNQRNRTMANDSLGRIYGYNIASNGSITFNNNNNKKKFAEDYNINIKDVDKVRRRRRNGVTKFYLNGKELTRKGE